jgi:hypothetical protein
MWPPPDKRADGQRSRSRSRPSAYALSSRFISSLRERMRCRHSAKLCLTSLQSDARRGRNPMTSRLIVLMVFSMTPTRNLFLPRVQDVTHSTNRRFCPISNGAAQVAAIRCRMRRPVASSLSERKEIRNVQASNNIRRFTRNTQFLLCAKCLDRTQDPLARPELIGHLRV